MAHHFAHQVFYLYAAFRAAKPQPEYAGIADTFLNQLLILERLTSTNNFQLDAAQITGAYDQLRALIITIPKSQVKRELYDNLKGRFSSSGQRDSKRPRRDSFSDSNSAVIADLSIKLDNILSALHNLDSRVSSNHATVIGRLDSLEARIQAIERTPSLPSFFGRTTHQAPLTISDPGDATQQAAVLEQQID